MRKQNRIEGPQRLYQMPPTISSKFFRRLNYLVARVGSVKEWKRSKRANMYIESGFSSERKEEKEC